jgi:hypothetical protein
MATLDGQRPAQALDKALKVLAQLGPANQKAAEQAYREAAPPQTPAPSPAEPKP